MDKDFVLEKLTLLRGILSGDIDPATLGLNTGKGDGANRRTAALALVDLLGGTVLKALEDEKKQHDDEPFGFARWTSENQRKLTRKAA